MDALNRALGGSTSAQKRKVLLGGGVLTVLTTAAAVRALRRRRRIDGSSVYAQAGEGDDAVPTVAEFQAELEQLNESGCLIERVDIDRVDPDNFSLLLVKLMQRRRHRGKAYSALGLWWLRLRGTLLGKRGLGVTEQLHVVLVGRRFSTKMSHMVFKPATKTFELEIFDQGPDQPPKLIEVGGKDLGKYIKQEAWEELIWDREEEKMLLELSAAQVRACIAAAGIEAWEYELYDGGFAEKAGIACHIHGMDWQMHRDLDCSSFELVPGGELGGKRVAEYRQLSTPQRRALFEQYHAGPPPAMKMLAPLSSFNARCHGTWDRTPIILFLGAPAVTVSNSFAEDPALAARVVYACSMGGSWDGSQNLLGVCFNNAVAYEASKVVFGGYENKGKSIFPNGRSVLMPTEACKMGPFTLHADDVIAKLDVAPPRRKGGKGEDDSVASVGERFRKVIADEVRQWTALKRGETQALFDVTTAMPITTLVAHAAVVRARVSFGSNKFAAGSHFADMGMTMRNFEAAALPGDVFDEPDPVPPSVAAVPGLLAPDSPFPGNALYAVERVFHDSCAAAFQDVMKDCCALSDDVGMWK